MKSIIRHIPRGGVKTASYVLWGLFIVPLMASAVDMPDGYTHLGWIESDTTNKQWIDTGYIPGSNTVIRMSFRPGTRTGNWHSFLGVFNVNDNSNNGVVLRWHSGDNKLNGIFCNGYDQTQIAIASGNDYDVVLTSSALTVGSDSATITCSTANAEKIRTDNKYSIYVFGENNVGGFRRNQAMRLYSLDISEADGSSETPVRSFLPCIDPDGKYGLWDTVGGEFYGNKASDGDFTGGGLKYVVNNGVMTASEGELPAGAMTGITKIEKITSGTFGVGAYATLPAVEVQAGGFSLQNNASVATTAISLSIFGGASLGFDVTASGSDSLAVGSLALDSSVTDANPITIKVNPFGVVGLDNSLMLLSGGNLSAADLALFTLDTTLPSVLEIVDGNLVLSPVPVAPGVWTGTGGNGNWSTVGNWDAGEAPANGAAVTLGVAAGGTTTMDISGYVAKSITIPAESGSYAHGGGALTVTGSITDNSAAEQTFSMPLTLGVAGSSFAITSAGDLNLTGAITENADVLSFAPSANTTTKIAAVSGSGTLAKLGEGVLELTAQSPDFTGDIEITGGTLKNGNFENPFPSAANGATISVSNGGTLDLGPSTIGEDKIKFTSRKLVIGGDGVGGKGAVVYNGGGKHQYYVFNRAELSADATVGCESGRWDVRGQGGVGTFDFNGHSLTKVGSGLFALSAVAVTTGDEPVSVNIDGGTLLVENNTPFTGAQNEINVASGAKLQVYNLSTPISWTVNFAGGATFDCQNQATGGNKLTGPVTFGEGNVTFSVLANYNPYLDGAIEGDGKLVKSNPGSLYLTGGAKTFAGGIEIANGRLVAVDKNQLPGYETGKISITGANAGLLLQASGWTVSDLATLNQNMSIPDWKSYIGYQNDTSSEIVINGLDDKTKGGYMLMGTGAPIKMTDGTTLEDGMFVASGDVEISGADTVVAAKRVELLDANTTLTVKDGATLKVTDNTSDVGDIVVGQLWTSPSSIQRLVVDNATVACDPLPGKGAKSSAIRLGTANMGVGILELKNGASVSHKFCAASYEWSRSAIYVDETSVITNYGGTGNNDGFIAGDGVGYLENAGTTVFKGYSQVCQGSNRDRAVGLLYNSGNVVFTGEYDGELDISRGGTGVIYQYGGMIEATGGGFQFNSNHGAARGLAIWTVEGASSVAKGAYFFPVNKDGTTSIINLREGGTIDYGAIKARNSGDYAKANTPFYVNLDGGFLKPQSTGTVFFEGERYQPNKVVAFAGGAGFDIGEGVTSTLNFPISKPEGRGIASITPSAEALAQTYVGAPYVKIEGDGYGATAVAIFDYATKRITGIKVTSPGCNYTTATVTLVGGRADNNNEHTATATLTEEGVDQACGGIVKRGAGKLVIGADTLPTGIPVTVADGTLDLGGITHSASSLTLRGGRIENGAVATATFVVPAEDMIAGRHTTMSGTLAFAEGSTLTIADLDFEGLEARKYFLVEADVGIEGLENLTISPAAPKGWRYELRGSTLTLAPHIGLAVIVR